MAFEPRRWDDLTEDLIDHVLSSGVPENVQSTDLNEGSLQRAQLEAVALLMEEFQVRLSQGVTYAIQEAAFNAFGFERLSAQPAAGSVMFQSLSAAATDITIPSGSTVVSDSGVQFKTLAPGVIYTGQVLSAPVAIQAVIPGKSGNLASGAITRMGFSIPGVDAVLQGGPTLGGAEVETDEDRRDRFNRYIATLARGTKEALEFAATEALGPSVHVLAVEPATLSPRPDGVPDSGLVWLVIDDGSGAASVPGSMLATLEQAMRGYVDINGVQVPGWKSAGVRVDYRMVTSVEVSFSAKVTATAYGVSRWNELQAALSSALTAFISEVPIGGRISYQNLVVALTASDPDIVEVDLMMWKKGDPVPTVMSAEDFTLGTLEAAKVNTTSPYPQWTLGGYA